jgi:hypothetical protein
MAFTYTGALDTDLERVRFYLVDTVEDAGPRPDEGNFTDEELLGLVAIEGTWQRAVAGGYERLASEWFPHVSYSADNFSVSSSHTGKNHADMAKLWRDRYGFSRANQGYNPTGVSRLTIISGHNEDD